MVSCTNNKCLKHMILKMSIFFNDIKINSNVKLKVNFWCDLTVLI